MNIYLVEWKANDNTQTESVYVKARGPKHAAEKVADRVVPREYRWSKVTVTKIDEDKPCYLKSLTYSVSFVRTVQSASRDR